VEVVRSFLLLTAPALVAVILLLELSFRFVIPAAESPYYYYDLDDRILRFSTVHQREGLYTMGHMATQHARWHINNAGWNSPIEFEGQKSRPRIAVIGDSYVEALQVDAEQSFTGRLRRLFSQGTEVDVYAFGISGATLTQYLQMARYVRNRFDPDVFVINVVHNDFAESLCSIHRQPGMLCLEEDGGALYEASIVPYKPDPLLRMARNSSLVRYLVINLQIRAYFQRVISATTTNPRYNAGVDVDRILSERSRIVKATEYIMGALEREIGKNSVLVVIDAPRNDIYAGSMKESTVAWLNQVIKQKATQNGFSFIDLTEAFKKSFETDRVRLEWPNDGHWNEKGHEVVANVLHDTLRALPLKSEHSLTR
jgi:lysophospholipase L1-like esterase